MKGMETMKMTEEIRLHLTDSIIPFWKALRDDEYGGYYGYMDYDLKLDKTAEKGCILSNRIIWFFSNAYMLLKDETLLDEAKHAYEFMQKYCIDREKGGVYWSVQYDGVPADTTKHTYNQAFAVYALCAYYEASDDKEALQTAMELSRLIESRCMDEVGYLEAFDRDFVEVDNDKLSENGVMAQKTMNTLLHVFEAYTELYRLSGDSKIKERLEWILDTFADQVYNPGLHRQEVFFDREMHSILDLHSFGHDIETTWLIDRGLEVLGDEKYREKMMPMLYDMIDQVYQKAFDGHSLANECEKGVVDETRTWWVQAETIVGFLNAYKLMPEKKEYLEAAKAQWEFIKEHVIDKRPGGEWLRDVTKEGEPLVGEPVVEPWKCPYHNGRMCIEVIRRSEDVK